MWNDIKIAYQSKYAHILLHLPDIWNGYEEALMGEVSAFIEACKAFPEYADSRCDRSIGKLSRNSPPYFIEKGLQNVSCDILFTMPRYKNPRKIRIFCIVNRAAEFSGPMFGEERTVNILIPKEIVRLLGCDWLREQMIRMRRNLRATYAYLDTSAFGTGTIYFENYMVWGQKLSAKEMECYVPGFHWLQFFSEEMISVTGTPWKVAESAPCVWAEADEQGQAPGVWLQMSDNLWGNPMKGRKAYRDYFARSLRELDWNRIAEFAKAPFYSNLIQLTFFPWTDEERERVNRLMADAEEERRVKYPNAFIV